MKFVYRSTNIRRFLRVNFADVPAKRFGHWVECVLALGGCQGTVQHALRHGDLQFDVFELLKNKKSKLLYISINSVEDVTFYD